LGRGIAEGWLHGSRRLAVILLNFDELRRGRVEGAGLEGFREPK